jgi:hypothetical protein
MWAELGPAQKNKKEQKSKKGRKNKKNVYA